MGLDDQITLRKTHMGIVKGDCNSTHEHGSHCAPLKRMLFILERTARANRTSCVSVVHHLLKAEGKSDLSRQGQLYWKGLVWFLHSWHFLEKKLNLTYKTIAEGKKRPQQFDVSTPFCCQYFDRFHDSIIICRDPCQGFNCYMRNYTFSWDVGTKHWLHYYY